MLNLFKIIAILFISFNAVAAETQQSTNNYNDENKANESVNNYFWGIEYMPNISNFTPGVQIGSLETKASGWYIDFKLNQAAEDSRVSYQTAKNYFGDSETNVRHSLLTFTGGKTYGFTNMFFIAGGIGFQSATKYVEFNDPTGILGQSGQYWVKKESSSSLVLELKGFLKPKQDSSILISLGFQTGIVGLITGLAWTY